MNLCSISQVRAGSIYRYYLPVQDGTLVSLSRQILRGQMGLMEQGYNRGKFIRDYGFHIWGKYTDNYYYCMAGQYYCLDSAARILNLPNPLMKTAHCLTQLNFAKNNSIMKEIYYPKIDDILIWGNGSAGHTGRIVEVIDKQKQIVRTGEMNTSLAKGQDDRNGGGNSFKKRYLKLPLNRMKFKGAINFKTQK